jgi:hypothetical protein
MTRNCRRLPGCLDGPPCCIGFSFSLHTSTPKGCPTKLVDRLCSSGRVCNTSYHLVFIAALKSGCTNSVRSLSLPERTFRRSRRTRAL